MVLICSESPENRTRQRRQWIDLELEAFTGARMVRINSDCDERVGELEIRDASRIRESIRWQPAAASANDHVIAAILELQPLHSHVVAVALHNKAIYNRSLYGQVFPYKECNSTVSSNGRSFDNYLGLKNKLTDG